MSDNGMSSKLGMSFSIRRGRLLIHYATIKAIGEPDYIRFLINKRYKKIAIQSCEEIDSDHFRVPKHDGEQDYRFEISSIQFVSVLFRICNLDNDKTYVVYGTLHPKHRLVEFELDQAKEIRPEQFLDSEKL